MKARAHACANCGTTLHGEYCSACGQKRLADADRRFGHLLRQFVEAATDLDGRFWGTLRALLFQPGRLSRDYLDGRRVRWMPPIALFLLVNLVYFLFAQQSDFATPFEWEVPGRIALDARGAGSVGAQEAARLRGESGPLHSVFTAEWVERRVRERDAATGGYTVKDYATAYNAKVPEVSKALAIVHVPLLAVALMLLFPGRRYYAEHFVVALHLVAFYMAVIQIFGHGSSLVHLAVPPAAWHTTLVNWMIRIVLAVYLVVALRRTYSASWSWSAAATLGVFLAYGFINFHLYRPVLFLTVFALT